MNTPIIAQTPTLIKTITYQVVTSNEQNKTQLISINILLENKIIKRIRLEDQHLEFDKTVVNNIILNFLKIKLTTNNTRAKKTPVNKTAKTKAASDLINNLNI